jgi:hypothetical protein
VDQESGNYLNGRPAGIWKGAKRCLCAALSALRAALRDIQSGAIRQPNSNKKTEQTLQAVCFIFAFQAKMRRFDLNRQKQPER